jgi:hypothetical protein
MWIVVRNQSVEQRYSVKLLRPVLGLCEEHVYDQGSGRELNTLMIERNVFSALLDA